MSSQGAVATGIDTVPTDDSAAVNAAIEAVEESLRKSKTGPPVSSISSELITDSNGMGAATITVVLKDNPSGELYSWDQLRPMHNLIWKEFTERELSRWPYIRFRLESEADEEDEEFEAGSEQQC